MNGQIWAIIGIALSTILCGIGSSLGLRSSVAATSGVLAGEPGRFSKVMVITLLPATQGIYGLLISFMGLSHIPPLLEATATAEQILANTQAGVAVLVACLPMA
ncbi:MAG: permease, partial [Clostridia bacterium]